MKEKRKVTSTQVVPFARGFSNTEARIVKAAAAGGQRDKDARQEETTGDNTVLPEFVLSHAHSPFIGKSRGPQIAHAVGCLKKLEKHFWKP